MAKWDFNLSTYAQLWNDIDNGGLLQTFLDSEMVRMNYGFWASQFIVDPNITPRQADGTSTFSSKMRKQNAALVMDMRAPLGETKAGDKTGVEFYTATIPDFSAPSYHETAAERLYKEKMFEEYFGNDSQILLAYADKLQEMIDAADQSLNYMSAQLLSKGNITYDIGRGAQGDLYEAKIPADNFVKAGEAVWSTTTTKILDQMRQIEEDAYDRWGVSMPMKWQIPYQMFRDVFLKNEQVLEWIRYTKSMDNVLLPEVFKPTQQMALDAIAMFEGVSPIEIIVEKQKDYSGIVHGWEDNKAVLRPQGYAGTIKHTTILDESVYGKYGSSVIQRTFGRAGNSGIYTVMNSTLNNGNLREWHTDLFAAAVPALDEFLYHVIVDTATAND